MSSRLRTTLIVAGAALVTGCGALTSPVVCTSEARSGIAVEVLDSSSNAPVGEGAKITARDGAFIQTAITADEYPGPYGLAHERAGVYTVTVQQDGYAIWTRSDVVVTRDQCHVRTVELTALLQP
ncbi:MAG TPA: carboxypeptidase-like regulatory domain-containing protein [Gemmatimonadaceae bacterium]